MPVQVLENLFIGCLDDVENRGIMAALGVQAILTVDSKPLGKVIQAVDAVCEMTYKLVPVLDVDTEDILSHLAHTNQYIEESRSQEKAVIVHWLEYSFHMF